MRALDAFSHLESLPEWMLNSFLRIKKFSLTYLLFWSFVKDPRISFILGILLHSCLHGSFGVGVWP